jgi:hypothetical protein
MASRIVTRIVLDRGSIRSTSANTSAPVSSPEPIWS